MHALKSPAMHARLENTYIGRGHRGKNNKWYRWRANRRRKHTRGHRPNLWPCLVNGNYNLHLLHHLIKMSSLFRHTQVCAHILYNLVQLDYSNFVQLKHNTYYCCIRKPNTHVVAYQCEQPVVKVCYNLLLRCATNCTVAHYTTDLSWDGTSLIL